MILYENFAGLFKKEDPEAYKKLAQAGMMIGHTVKINGQTHRPDNGLHYHATVKIFDPANDSKDAIHAIARDSTFTPPDAKTTSIEPAMFEDRFGNDVHVLKFHGEHADKLKENNAKFDHMGFKSTYEFSPHVSVDKATWEGIVASGAKTAHEAGIEFGHAQLKQGDNLIANYRRLSSVADVSDKHKVLHMPVKEEKLAASEDMSLDKSNYGPAGADLYSAADNARRKMGRTSETVEGAGPNKAVHATKPSFKQQADVEARASKAKSKTNPVRMLSAKEKNAFAKKKAKENKPAKVLKLKSPVNPHFQAKLAASEAANLVPMEKGFIKQATTAAAMAATLGLSTPVPEAAPAMNPPAQHAQHDSYSSKKMLNAISQVESSGGKFVNHRELHGMHEGSSAFGKYGLTDLVIKETLGMNKDLKAKHSKASSLTSNDLHHYMQDNPGLEDQVASKHLARLEHHFGKDPAKLGFSWLNGIKATYRAAREKEDFGKHWHAAKVKAAYDKGI